MEQLLDQAHNLHREAALLSNTLHQYRDDDVEGVRPVVQQIIATRNKWKKVRQKIEYFEKTGKLPEEAVGPVSVNLQNGGAISELKLEVARLSANISKSKKKIEHSPDAKKAGQWRENLAKLEALKAELRNRIIELTYATT